MGEFLAEIAVRVGWAIPVGVVLWFLARRFTWVTPSPDAADGTRGDRIRPAWQRAVVLLVVAVLLWGLAVGLGWLITRVLAPVRDVDVAIIEWLGENRTDLPTAFALAID